ncbi:hypothetical protein FPV67DRAFT_1432087 [Lyophyllum atratum]|nr:hypothetical protein FPV67DRAFT_1432087 [Lyophyllum atratum]
MDVDRDTFLDEFLRLDGRGEYTDALCPCNRSTEAKYRCKDCFFGQLLCSGCVIAWHACNPLHDIERWNGLFFERTTLKQLGLRIQLNHPPNQPCVNPKAATADDFIIIDSHGVHEVALDFCKCERGIDDPLQLLRARLYPATGTIPKTAATFNCLKHFQLLSFESKCSAYEFFNSVSRETDNTGLLKHRDRYDEFLRVVRQWRHTKMLKRAGRGHDCQGIMATKPGQCAVLCPACPQPGINLPPNWEMAPEDRKFLYALFIGMDANFRLKRKVASSEERDPSLGGGWAFFVEEKAYKAYLGPRWNQKQERSDCVDHDAVNKPDREARGLAASGAGTIDCSRHDFKRPLGVGDLQKGERYLNMDYMFLQSVRDTGVQMIVVSYDIVCQWHKNLRERMLSYPHELHLSGSVKYISFLIPKFHLPAHIEDCNILYSFNLVKGVGRTDGEAPERGWANINPIAQSTKEMGPGARRDTLDDHFNDWNWKKTLQFGPRLLKKLREAAPALVEHRAVLRDFVASLPSDVIERWQTEVDNWERDSWKPSPPPNPYKSSSKAKSERDVRLELAQELAAKEVPGDKNAEHGHHATVMIANGLALGDEQYKLATDAAELSLNLHPTSKQLSSLLERSNQLRRKIAAWIEIQTLFLPEAARERAKAAQKAGPNGVAGVKAEDIDLWLPSALKKEGIIVSDELQGYEWRLREGQANDALDELRRVLRLRSHLYAHKDRYTRGVKANTRANVAISTATQTIKKAASKYRTARDALVILSRGRVAPPHWETKFRVLGDGDIRALSEGLHGDPVRQKTYKPSWIWSAAGVAAQSDGDPELNDALRIEWCRTRARVMRWEEEVDLLQEEMRRVSVYLSWKARWWLENSSTRIGLGLGKPTEEGIAAYSRRQAAQLTDLCTRFKHDWEEVPLLMERWADNDDDTV